MEDITNIPQPASSADKHRGHDDLTETAIVGDAMTTASVDGNVQSSGLDTTTGSDAVLDLENLSIDDQTKLEEEVLSMMTTHPILHDYLMKQSQDYQYVNHWRRKGWASVEGDIHFMVLREKSDNPDAHTQQVFYNQMCQIGEDMDSEHNLALELELTGGIPKVLDLCMAPGGFSGTILDNTPRSRVCGVSLPFDEGGHPLCIEDWENRGVKVHWIDITMLSKEMGLDSIPPDHPEFSQFSDLRPYLGQSFALVFCDGNALRTHVRPSYREEKEKHRLLTSQLVLAFQRIRQGGTLVCRFHKIESIDTATMLQLFSKISRVYTFKPEKIHGARSSFYMIAKDVQPNHPRAVQAVEMWKREWTEATLDTEERECGASFDNEDPVRIKQAKDIVDEFGPRLIALAQPIWKIQADALRRKPFFTGRETTFASGSGRRRKSLNQNARQQPTPGSWTKNDWRSSNALEGSSIKATSSVPAVKTDRYLMPQQRRGSFKDGDTRGSNHVKSRTFYESRVPVNSGFWRGDPRTSTSNEFKDDWNTMVPRENIPYIAANNESKNESSTSATSDHTPDTTTLGRRIVASDKIASIGIGRPGGSLVNSTNLSASPVNQLRRFESNPMPVMEGTRRADYGTANFRKAPDAKTVHELNPKEKRVAKNRFDLLVEPDTASFPSTSYNLGSPSTIPKRKHLEFRL